ncbi:unnamed protein product [Diatraea saccharalis]|uniref:Small ribosomal subunit protein uS12m n=1 Tax=Diatraea saccharalis TaxID=40085 RepID=A0A9P0G2M4_9NEOP|nr:unnamed protein product [Diatraea saccharalis]
MNFIRSGLSLLSLGIKSQFTQLKVPGILCNQVLPSNSTTSLGLFSRAMASLAQMHRSGPHIKKRKSRNPLNGNPFAKGVVLKTVIKKPKKPNSANRKCVLVRLSNGKEMIAYIPGIGHNLQEHNIVLVRVGRSVT